ncbi:rRNA maturation RNase YbeY [Stieleria sp. JC731]|uniref:rRNA maturation RNase YbeY n=1 Tax=Pirellulaceae TaxID=2691357 RepID=UPI001E42786E|nr:rRNA maturation RNase YbeY [Stieleria sp. JC731]MCC9601822.1 rRNA maturation RNase YbeY [Stieleria sp. JC731]
MNEGSDTSPEDDCSRSAPSSFTALADHAAGALAQNDAMIIDLIWDDCVADWRDQLGLSNQRICDAAKAAAAFRGFDQGQLGVLITDDASIHEINRDHLHHDYPTDVISFPYAATGDHLEGELVVSIETAAENAKEYDSTTDVELLLYVIHGVLHIGGMDDHEDHDRQEMRDAERAVLARLGIEIGEAPQA